jgi:undecaprenyl-diphosphatase
MNQPTAHNANNRALRLDISLCRRCNRFADKDLVLRYFSIISRLGDGVFWYVLMLLLPFAFGLEALPASLHMGATALCALLLYRRMKRVIKRPRPYTRHDGVMARIPPLDEFSFPSGHTLHAVAFTTIAVAWLPAMAWLLLPFTFSIALSRVVLGVHYPSDVIAAAAIGFCLGKASLWLGSLAGLQPPL